MSAETKSVVRDEPPQAKPEEVAPELDGRGCASEKQAPVEPEEVAPGCTSEKQAPVKPEEVASELDRRRRASEEQAPTPEVPPPEKLVLAGWHIYSFCSHFVHDFLVPVLFPLMITQRAWPKSDVLRPPEYTPMGVACGEKQMIMYERLTHNSITVGGSKFSPLGWTTIPWAAGVILAVPTILLFSHHLDHGHRQQPILVGAIVTGAFSCLLTGFFKTNWLFPVLIAAVAISTIIGAAVHVRHLGLMVRQATAARRRANSSRLSFHGTAAGSLGAAIIAAFSYHMLRRSDQLTSLWVVFIFSGLLWLVGVAHATFSPRYPEPSSPTPPNCSAKCAHTLAIFTYPHAVGGLAAAFLSSFACMCVFASGTLHIVGDLCVRPLIVLFVWMIYFASSAVSLLAAHPVQLAARADAVRMQVLGLFASVFTAGIAFYFKDARWKQGHILLVALLQGAANGVLHASGRALLVDCSPAGKEGAFGVWFGWARAAGGCAGYAVGTRSPGNVRTTFAAAFLASLLGVFVLVFGNVSSVRGMEAAGHAKEEPRERPPVLGSNLA